MKISRIICLLLVSFIALTSLLDMMNLAYNWMKIVSILFIIAIFSLEATISYIEHKELLNKLKYGE